VQVLGADVGKNVGINCSYNVCKLLMVWARDGTLVGQFKLINFVTNPFTVLLRHPPVEVTTYLNLVTCSSPLGNRAALTQNMNNVHFKTKVSRSTLVEQIEKHNAKINGTKIDGTNA